MSNITQVINTDKYLKTLKKGVHASDLDQLLSSTGPYTLFAPSDIAFEKLSKGTMADLLEPSNKAKLLDLLNNHIVSGKIFFKELKNGDKLKTLSGRELTVQVKEGSVTVDNAKLLERDGRISNGVMHLSDAVIQLN